MSRKAKLAALVTGALVIGTSLLGGLGAGLGALAHMPLEGLLLGLTTPLILGAAAAAGGITMIAVGALLYGGTFLIVTPFAGKEEGIDCARSALDSQIPETGALVGAALTCVMAANYSYNSITHKQEPIVIPESVPYLKKSPQIHNKSPIIESALPANSGPLLAARRQRACI